MQIYGYVNSFFFSVDSKAIDANKQIPDETLQQLKKFGLFGQQIPKEYGLYQFLILSFYVVCNWFVLRILIASGAKHKNSKNTNCSTPSAYNLLAAVLFTPHCLSSISCINEYLAIDSYWYM